MVLLGDPGLPDRVKNGGRFNAEDVDVVTRLRAALSSIGDYSFYYVDHHAELADQLRSDQPALVFNLCDEGFNNDPAMELHVPALLEMLGINYTGAPPSCLAACYDKSLVRALALSMNIPVPDEIRLSRGALDAAKLPFPLFVKPARADGSFGIRRQSYVENEAELLNALKWLEDINPGEPCLVQEFLPGAEFSLGIIGNADTGLRCCRSSRWTTRICQVDRAFNATLPNGILHSGQISVSVRRCWRTASCARCRARQLIYLVPSAVAITPVLIFGQMQTG